MTISFTPLTSVFGGEVGPIDLRKVHDRETLVAIRAGMDLQAVLVCLQNTISGNTLDEGRRESAAR